MPPSADCPHCRKKVENDGVACDLCNQWYHRKCVLSNLKLEQIKGLNWFCNACKSGGLVRKSKFDQMVITYNEEKKKFDNEREVFKREIERLTAKCAELEGGSANSSLSQLEVKLDALTASVESNFETLKTNIDVMPIMLHDIAQKIVKVDKDMKLESKKEKSYAETLKTKKVLLIKSTCDEGRAANEKKAIMSDITTPVEEVKETKDGHLFIRFADKKDLENAKKEIEDKNDANITVKEKSKLKPKIKLINISKDEDDVIRNIKMKNSWIGELVRDDDDLKLVKTLDARTDGLMHCIIKCTPEIRKAIYEKGDSLYTMYGHGKIYDCYMPYQCFKCQEFGHSASHCNKNQVCQKCGEDHRSTECTNNEAKCNNCVMKKYNDTEHRTYDSIKCSVYKEEIARVKNNTDHGFD